MLLHHHLLKASKALSDAALTISESPVALQLRFLQTLTTIRYFFGRIWILEYIKIAILSAEKNRTIIFPFPIEIIRYLLKYNFGDSNSDFNS